MNVRRRVVTGFLASATVAGSLFAGVAPALARKSPANQREKNWRGATYVGAAGTAYALAKGKGTWALIGAGATLLSYNQWKKEIRRRHQRDDSRAAYNRYRSAWHAKHRGNGKKVGHYKR